MPQPAGAVAGTGALAGACAGPGAVTGAGAGAGAGGQELLHEAPPGRCDAKVQLTQAHELE